MINRLPYWAQISAWVSGHKFWSAVIALMIVGGGSFVYARANSASGETRYVLGTVASSTIIASVSGSGQVSPSNQVEIKPKASGEYTSVLVKQGDTVRSGQVLAYIDARDAQKSVRDAEANLQSAEISLAKLKQPPTTLTLTQAQNALTNAEDSLAKLYSDSESDVTEAFLDLPEIITGLQGIIADTDTNSSKMWNLDYYLHAIERYETNSVAFHDTSYQDYVNARKAYDESFAAYQAMGDSPDNATIEKMLDETRATSNLVAKALKSTNAFIQLYKDTLSARSLTVNPVAETALSTLNTYSTQANTHLSTALDDITSLKSDKQAIVEKRQSLEETNAGADALDIQSAELNVTKARNALTDAQNELADYAVRAPFAGTIAQVDAKKADVASTGAAAATIITADQIADLSFNEVDVAKVQVGQKVTLTFDAVEGLSIAGKVASVDTLGTVSQGVVSYNIKIEFSTQDARVKPGMTVNASIITDTATNALSVPAGAIKTQNGESYVRVFEPMIVDADPQGISTKQTPQNIPVTVGITDDTNVQILSGLVEGQQIIVRTINSTSQTTTQAPSLFGGPGSGGAARTGNVRFQAR